MKSILTDKFGNFIYFWSFNVINLKLTRKNSSLLSPGSGAKSRSAARENVSKEPSADPQRGRCASDGTHLGARNAAPEALRFISGLWGLEVRWLPQSPRAATPGGLSLRPPPLHCPDLLPHALPKSGPPALRPSCGPPASVWPLTTTDGLRIPP